MYSQFMDVMKIRRSQYTIGNEVTMTDEDVMNMIEDAVLHTPTAFNMQSGRVVVLLHDEHNRLWNITREELRKIVPADSFQLTDDKINTFMAGYGTILFFDDEEITQSNAEQFPLYKDSFPIYAQQANGMLQFAVWNLLAEHGLGASLQHYNPLIDEEVKNTWNLPQSWKLLAQMPFGNILSPADSKSYVDIAERVKVFK